MAAQGKVLRVLLVEDCVDDNDLLLRQLRQSGYLPQYRRAETLEEFEAALDEGSWDVILADYTLPRFGAPQAWKAVQQRGLDIPCIVVTGTVSDEVVVDLMKQGIADYLLKDRLGRLGAAVEQAMAARAARLAQQQTARALQESESRYRALVEYSTDGVVVLQGTEMVFENEAFRALLAGTECSATLASSIQVFTIEDDRAEVVARVRAVQQAGAAPDRLEFRIRQADGAVRTVEMALAAMHHAGRPAAVATLRDITERKRMEAALRQANERLAATLDELRGTQKQVIQQERLHALGEMSSGIAHDFNNALAPIVGFTELLLDREELLANPTATRTYLELVHAGAMDAAAVVARLRDFYRPRGERDVLSAFDLNRVVEQTIALTQPRWKDQAQAAGKTIKVVTDLGVVPPISGSEPEWREALTNLIFNAVDAIERQGTISILTQPAGSMVILEVADDGNGMPEEVRRRCLEPFFTTKGQDGTGLGLSMVHGTVRRHQGTLSITSEKGYGTVFDIRLPVSVQFERVEEPEEDVLPMLPQRVLVVDDDARQLALLANVLSYDGHFVVMAGNGSEALRALRNQHFDAVVTDRAMPDMNGDALALAVKALSPNTPVLLLTGFGDMMNAAAERPAGVDAVLAKPITAGKLREALGSVTRVLQGT